MTHVTTTDIKFLLMTGIAFGMPGPHLHSGRQARRMGRIPMTGCAIRRSISVRLMRKMKMGFCSFFIRRRLLRVRMTAAAILRILNIVTVPAIFHRHGRHGPLRICRHAGVAIRAGNFLLRVQMVRKYNRVPCRNDRTCGHNHRPGKPQNRRTHPMHVQHQLHGNFPACSNREMKFQAKDSMARISNSLTGVEPMVTETPVSMSVVE